MKKTIKALFGFFALFSLIACGGDKSPSKSEVSSSSNSIVESSISSSQEEISSSYEEVTSISSNNADEDWSIIESSSSAEVSSVIESSSIGQSSSSDSQSSSLEGTYYHVTFVNYDDSVLYEIDVLEGEEATYVGDEPTRPDDDEFTYTFKNKNGKYR